ncbi:MAG: hypothetical protein ACXAEL_12625 [Candidatus Hodarchaeales archaeon]|jgi:hypothetical protein
MTVSSPRPSEKKAIPNSEQRASPRNIALWTTYDIANTIFSMGIVSVTILRFVQLQGMKEGVFPIRLLTSWGTLLWQHRTL